MIIRLFGISLLVRNKLIIILGSGIFIRLITLAQLDCVSMVIINTFYARPIKDYRCKLHAINTRDYKKENTRTSECELPLVIRIRHALYMSVDWILNSNEFRRCQEGRREREEKIICPRMCQMSLPANDATLAFAKSLSLRYCNERFLVDIRFSLICIVEGN